MPRALQIILPAILLAATACGGAAKELSSKRAHWTADTFYADFMAEFGADVSACYPDYAFRDGPALPTYDGPSPRPLQEAVIVLDASGSMAGRVGGERKMDAAKAAVRSFAAQLPDGVESGLIAFGQKGNNREDGKALSCAGVELVAPLAKGNGAGIAAKLDGFDATGWTPLASAIEMAADSLTRGARGGDHDGAQVVFVVSDGNETCGGDPVAAARKLHDSEIKGIVHIIGFDVTDKEQAALRAVAEAGGGRYFAAQSGNELSEQLSLAAGNIRRSVEFDAAAVTAKTANESEAARTSVNAEACVVRAHVNEMAQFTLVSLGMAGDPSVDAALLAEVKKRIETRQQAEQDTLAGFKAALQADLERANAPIEQSIEQKAKTGN